MLRSPLALLVRNLYVRQYVWNYHYLDHIQSMHPDQKLTEEEIKYALDKEEYLRVLDKDYVAKE